MKKAAHFFCMTLIGFIALLGARMNAQDHRYAPSSFTHKNAQAVFIDFKHVNIHYVYDVSRKRAVATSRISFDVIEEGQPIIVLKPKIKTIRINNANIDLSRVTSRRDPDNQTPIIVIEDILGVGSHSMEIEHDLNSENLVFGSDYVRSAFFVSDLDVVAEGLVTA